MSGSDIIPEGYYKDAQGRLVPPDLVRDVDKARDELVRELVNRAKEVQKTMNDFRESAMEDIGAFVDLAAEKYEVHLGGKKGNLTLASYDGRQKVQLQIAERIMFGEELVAAKELIDECLREWTEDSRDEIRVLVSDAFKTDKSGNLETGRILGLRRLNIKDARWQRAMQAISDAIRVTSTKALVRFYERRSADEKFEPIALDMASL